MTDQSPHYSKPTRNVRCDTGGAAAVALTGDRWLDRGGRCMSNGLRALRHGGPIEPAGLTQSWIGAIAAITACVAIYLQDTRTCA